MKNRVLLAIASAMLLILAACTDPVDTSPNPFAFPSKTGVEPNAVVTSDTVSITGINAETTATVTSGGELLVGGTEVGQNSKVTNGAQLAVRVTASPEFDTPVTVTVTVGGFEADFTVRTRTEGPQQGAFEFVPVNNAEPGVAVDSNEVLLSTLQGAATATVSGSGAQLLVDGAPAGTSAEVENGDRLAIRLVASDDFSETVSATVSLDGEEATFEVTTRAAIAPTVAITSNLESATPGDTVRITGSLVAGDADAFRLVVPQLGVDQSYSPGDTYEVDVTDEFPELEFELTATHSRHTLQGQDALTVEVPLWVCSEPTDVITIPDDALRASFYGQVGTPDDGPITCADAQAGDMTTWEIPVITEVGEGGEEEVLHGEIASLVGLQHFANLQRFIAPYNLVSDLRPVAGLANLEQLNLDKNLVLDLSPLAGMPNLRILEVWDNGPEFDENVDGIIDIGPLAQIPTLEELYLSENNISDLGPLAALPNLRVLYALINEISDISPLATLTNLQVLRLSANHIEDGSALANLENLAWLELEYNAFQDAALVPMESFQHLWAVKLEGNYFTDLSPLINNDDFPADHGVPGFPEHRQQPTHALITFGYNCLSEEDDLAAEVAFLAKGLEIDYGRRDELPDCDSVIGGASSDTLQRRQVFIQTYREEGRVR